MKKMHEDKHGGPNEGMEQIPKASADASHRETRRDLTKAGLAAPVILSLLSRPAWGGAMCYSGLQSGNTSNAKSDSNCSYGRSPGYWKYKVLGTPRWPGPFPTPPPGTDTSYHGCASPKTDGTISDYCKGLFQDASKIGSVPGLKTRDAGYPLDRSAHSNYTLMQVLWQLSGSRDYDAIATYFNALTVPGFAIDLPVAEDMVNALLSGSDYTDGNLTMSPSEIQAYFKSLYDPSDPFGP